MYPGILTDYILKLPHLVRLCFDSVIVLLIIMTISCLRIQLAIQILRYTETGKRSLNNRRSNSNICVLHQIIENKNHDSLMRKSSREAKLVKFLNRFDKKQINFEKKNAVQSIQCNKLNSVHYSIVAFHKLESL